MCHSVSCCRRRRVRVLKQKLAGAANRLMRRSFGKPCLTGRALHAGRSGIIPGSALPCLSVPKSLEEFSQEASARRFLYAAVDFGNVVALGMQIYAGARFNTSPLRIRCAVV